MARRSSAIAGAVHAFDALGASRRRGRRGYLVVPVSATATRDSPWLRWNAFAALLSHASVDELHPEQRVPWWAFGYDAEVQGGGHGAWFEHRGQDSTATVLEALRSLGAHAQAELL